MASTLDQRLQRLRVRLEELELWRDRQSADLDGWRFEGEPIALGAAWPRRDGVVCLEHEGARLPDGWPLADTRLEVAPGGEGLLRVHDEGGAVRSFGLDPWHRRFPLVTPSFQLSVTAVARHPFGVPNRGPRLESVRLVWVEPDLQRLLRRLGLAVAAAATLGGDVALLLVAAAERALARLDWPSETTAYLGRAAGHGALASVWSPPLPAAHPEPLSDATRASLRAANVVLDEELARTRALHPPSGRVSLAGHAHIDLAWLWPMEETQRKAQRTFHTAAELLGRYPEMTFTQTSVELYLQARETDPELFARIRELAATGRWEAVGGMWVEPDLNMTSGESLARQLLHGQRWFERELGARHRVAWLPDCFGFCPALPQLLLGAGIGSFFTTKTNWSETNPFPHDLFWWEGLDGSRVLAHTFRAEAPGRGAGQGGYNGDTSPESLMSVWGNFRGRATHPEALYSVGYGDGGGGITAGMAEDVRELAAFPALPELRFTRIDEFFDRLRASAEAGDIPAWLGEIYLELHRGTLTTQGRTKRLHRRAERGLVATEALGSLCVLLGLERPTADLARAWRLLLRNEFHDILPGSSIHEVYDQANHELAEAVAIASEVTDAALARLAPTGAAPAVLAVNPDLSARPLRLVAPETLPGAQPVDGGWALTGATPVAGLELAVVLAADQPAEPAIAERGRLENAFLRVELADDGTLASVFDKRAGREALAGAGNQLWAYVDKPRAWDAWDIDEGYAAQGEPLGPPEPIAVTETGPHRAAITVRWRYRSSTITQHVRLWANSPRLEFATEIDWHERRILLKARFPLAVRSPRATFETAFGVVERPTHRNTSWDEAKFEVAGHRFADLAEPGFGVALLNDGRHGHHALGSELGLSLLRSPIHPDATADEGQHEFTYAIVPHAGSWLEGWVLAEAEDLNRPLLARMCTADGPSRRRPLAVAGLPVGLGALKAAEEGDGLVLRVYEPQGARGAVTLELPEAWRVTSALNLLEDRTGEPDLALTPFQVRTLLLERTTV